jgi:hypothetical protein
LTRPPRGSCATRAQLGDTVEALAAKADVPARAHEQAARLAGRARETATQAGAAAPEPVRQVARTEVSRARQDPRPAALAAASAVLGHLALHVGRRRRG